MPETRLHTRQEILSEIRKIVGNATPESFNRSAEARTAYLFKLLDASGAIDGVDLPTNRGRRSTGELFRKARMEFSARTLDGAVLDFFGGKRRVAYHEENVISSSGSRIAELTTQRRNGRSMGAISELRDLSSLLNVESRTGLTEGTTEEGGATVPVGYIPQVFAAMKRTDQILEAANWTTATTSTGNPLNIPNLTDTGNSAVTIAEAAAQTFANASFGNLQFGNATMWTSKVIRASVQLSQDAVPALANTLGNAFRRRFARGFGASVVSTVLGDAPVVATTAGASAITQKDLLELVKGVDAEYASADTAGFAMNWNTLVYIFENVITTASAGDALYHARRDENGHYLLLGFPVFISNSLSDIGASAKPVVFGDWDRLIVRNVPAESVVLRYDELFMQNFEKGYEMLFRADAKILHAGGSGDDPLAVLQCHA